MNFLTFIGSEFVSSIGNGVYRVALNWILVTRYGTVRVLAMVQFLSLLFGAIVQMWSGALIDRYNGKRVLVLTNLILGVVAGIFAWDAEMRPSEFSTKVALICVVLIGAVGATVEPAFFSLVMRVQDKPDTDTANSWILGSYGLSGILGPIIGGVFTVTQGAWLGFAVDAMSFVVAAGLMALVSVNQQDYNKNPVQADGQNPWCWTWETTTIRRIFTVEHNARAFLFLGDSQEGVKRAAASWPPCGVFLASLGLRRNVSSSPARLHRRSRHNMRDARSMASNRISP